MKLYEIFCILQTLKLRTSVPKTCIPNSPKPSIRIRRNEFEFHFIADGFFRRNGDHNRERFFGGKVDRLLLLSIQEDLQRTNWLLFGIFLELVLREVQNQKEFFGIPIFFGIEIERKTFSSNHSAHSIFQICKGIVGNHFQSLEV